MNENLLRHPDFAPVLPDGLPEDWYLWAPREDLRPVPSSSAGAFALAGNGHFRMFGKLGQEVPARGGQWYEARVTCRAEAVEDLTLCSLFNLVFRKDGRLVREVLLDEVSREDEWLTVRKVALCPPNADTADLEIFFRHSLAGKLVLRSAALRETTAPAPLRTAKVAAVKHFPQAPATPESNRQGFCAMLDRAGHAGVDICCLPEACNYVALGRTAQEVAEPIEGESFQAYAAKAGEYGMWVVACYETLEEGVCHNTAVLIDRQGRRAGVYHKTHLHWPEYRDGVTPGDDYPVFQTDFGTIGMMICYDSWFPEVARLLAYKGAEAIFFPVWGYDEIVLRGRAVDNNVFMVAASLGSAATIISSNGDLIARTASEGVVTAEIALEARPTYAYVDRAITNGIPGATRWTRDTRSLREYDELREQILKVD